MGLMNCTDCGAKHSDANGTICPNCGRKHKVGFFDLSDEEKQEQEINNLIMQELDYETENFNDLRHKWRDTPSALECIDRLEKMWLGDGIGSKKNTRQTAGCMKAVYFGIVGLVMLFLFSFIWPYISILFKTLFKLF